MKKNAVLLALLSLPALADTANDIERITVTGDFRQLTLDQLSSSASVIGAARLDSRQATHIENMLNVAPNVNFTRGASRGRFVQIRGIGERSQFAEPINPSVSFLVDDFDFSGLAAAGVLFDTRQVEVYRGPQASNFGTGALAGAIKVVSNRPGDEADNHLEVNIASQSSFRVEGGYGTAVNDVLNVRVAAVHNSSDGFVENTYLDRDDTNGLSEDAARLALDWAVSDNTRFAFNYRWYDIDNGFDAFSLDNDNKTRSDEPGFDRQQTHGVSGHVYHSTNAGLLEVILTHASHNIEYGYDEDWTFNGFHPWGYTSFDAYYRDVRQQSAEVRFSSADNNTLFNNTTSWVIGARVSQSEQDLIRQYTYQDSDFYSAFDPVTSAMYGQLDTRLTDAFTLTSALRFEQYAYDYEDNAGVSHDEDTLMTGGKLALTYQQGEHFYYASVSRGFKGPGINYDERVSDNRRFFDAEYNWNYELGFKGNFSDAISLRAAVFYMDRENTQISDFEVQNRDDGSAAFVDVIANADIGTNRGAEAELNWQATKQWQLQVALGYLDATFEDYERTDGSVIAKRKQAQSPDFTANLFSQYWFTESISWRVEMDYKDSYGLSDGHDEVAPTATVFNTDISWQKGPWTTTLWIKNVFDKVYYVRGFGGFSNDPRDEYAFNEPYFQWGDGRQVGVTTRIHF
ncbi:TonB-dependent receptor [Aestuariibacter sp. A3R04]|uniref:TonB-dependent receptor n=1 Tax=Aestuariibacter sp. A3R04 TaxID=2841571 RepID=UPI001C09C901|nr:TonB-dependent receptor [Aestuariibacter sp. A3R04]MBU3022282.1 TonB-dependent receptor [Aestuariibacter sp. A3R04]